MAKLLGKAPNQVPTNADLGSMAFQDREGINVNTAVVANLVVTGATSVNTTFAVTNATSNVAFFASNGNIGFGNSTPGSALIVERSDNTFSAAVQVRNPNTGGQAQAILDLVTDDGQFRLFKASAAAGGAAGLYVSTADPLVLFTNTVARVHITSGGNVGISNTSPDATLAVTGTANISGNVVIGGSTRIYGPQTTFGGNSAALWTGTHLYANASTRSLILYAPATESTGAPFIFDTPNAIEFRLDSSPILTLNSDYTTTVNSITTFSKDVIMSGNLTVSGTTTYINTTQLNIGDNIITLNADLPGATAPTENAGIEVNRGSAANVSFIWNESGARWEANPGNNSTSEFRLVSNTYARAMSMTGGGMVDSWGTVANTGEFATFNIVSGVNRFRTNSRDYYISNTASDHVMVSAANGNVGIGNTTPTDKLSIAGTVGARVSSNASVVVNYLENSNTGTSAVTIQRLTTGADKSLTIFSSIGGYSGMYGSATAATHYTDFDDHIFRKIDGTVKAILAANGNVGIGNSTPAAKLTVAGGITSTSGDVNINNGFLYFGSAQTAPAIVKPASNTSQSYRLELYNLGGPNSVNAGAFWNGLHLTSPGGITNATSGSAFPRMSMFYSYTSNTAPTDLVFNMWAGNDAGLGTGVKLYSSTPAGAAGGIDIAANGNIGINTAAPYEKLMVNNGNGIITNEDSSTRFSILNRGNNTTARFPQLIVQHHSGNTSGGDTGGQPVVELIRLRGNTSVIQAIASGDVLGGFNTWGSNATSTLSSTRIQGIAEANFTTTATAGLQFLTTNAGTQAEVVRMSANGNVGIGNTTPTNKLSVAGSIKTTQSITIGNGGGAYQSGSIYSDGNWGMIIRSAQTSPSTAHMSFHDATDARMLTIYANNNVSIGAGNTTPTNKLTVDGNIYSNNLRRYTQTRALSTTVNDTIEIGTLYSQHGAHSVSITLQTTDSGFSTAKRYEISSYFGATGSTVYRKVLPLFDTGPFSTNDYDLEAYHNTETIGLRLRRTAGSTAGTIEIMIDDLLLQSEGATQDYYTPSSTTATGVAAVTDLFPGSRVINTGIGHATPNTFIVQANLTTAAITSNNTATVLNLPVSFGGSYTIFGTTGQTTINLTTSATTANQVVTTAVGLGSATWRTVKYLVSVTSGSAYQATEITLIHDGTNVYKTEYGQVFSGAVLATFDADINSGNIRLLTTPTNAVTTYKGMVTFVTV